MLKKKFGLSNEPAWWVEIRSQHMLQNRVTGPVFINETFTED